MRDPGREQKNVPFPDRNLTRFAVFHHPKNDVAFDLIKKLFARVNVIIGPLIWAADNHDHEIAVPNHRVAHRRLEQMPVLIDPGF